MLSKIKRIYRVEMSDKNVNTFKKLYSGFIKMRLD